MAEGRGIGLVLLAVVASLAACKKPGDVAPTPPPAASGSSAPVEKASPPPSAIPSAAASPSASALAEPVDPVDRAVPFTPDVIVFLGEESEWTLASLTRSDGVVSLRFSVRYTGPSASASLDGHVPRVVAGGKTYEADAKPKGARIDRGGFATFDVKFQVPDGVPAELELVGLEHPITRRVTVP